MLHTMLADLLLAHPLPALSFVLPSAIPLVRVPLKRITYKGYPIAGLRKRYDY